MQCYLFCCITFVLLIVNTTTPICTTKPNSAVIIALLPLHSGIDCSRVELRGLQQSAALRAVVKSLQKEVNKETNILMNIKFQDTCSSEDGAIKAALKSMVDSEQTCLHPPFFMGFLGPESKVTLDAVRKITKLFNTTHVVPYAEDSVPQHVNTVLHVTTKPLQNHAHSIITILKQLEWRTFSLIVEDSATNKKLVKFILDIAKDDSSFCITNVIRIANTANVHETLIENASYGIVVLVDSIEIATQIIKVNKILSSPMMLFTDKIGLHNWQIPSTNSTLIILQETMSQSTDDMYKSMNDSMYRTYIKQQEEYRDHYCSDVDAYNCSSNIDQDLLLNTIDASILPFSYAAKLLASALISAHRIKCQKLGSIESESGICLQISRMTSEEWQSILGKSIAFTKSAQNNKLSKKILFNMEIESVYDIYIKDHHTIYLEKIGRIVNGNVINLNKNLTLSLHSINMTRVNNTSCADKDNLEFIQTIWSLAPSVQLDPVEWNPEDEFYRIVTSLLGAGIGILVFFVFVTYIVYNSFKVKTNKQSSSGSSTVKRKPSRIARWRRDSGQSSKASIRTID